MLSPPALFLYPVRIPREEDVNAFHVVLRLLLRLEPNSIVPYINNLGDLAEHPALYSCYIVANFYNNSYNCFFPV